MQPLTPRQVLEYTEGSRRSCGSAYCDVWLVSAVVDVPGREALENLLSDDERACANGYRFEEDRARFVAARGGLRQILSSYSSIAPERIEFQTGSYGKPALLVPSAALEFNVSHSGDYALIAITSGVPCGVDIEGGKANLDEAAIAVDFFCPREVEWLSHNDGGFLRLWTAKEAVVKAVGGGLSVPLRSFDVTSALEGESSSIALATFGIEHQTLWLSELRLVPNYAAAVVTLGERRVVRVNCAGYTPGYK
jgi:4'-phosphopantetheinyl transferase